MTKNSELYSMTIEKKDDDYLKDVKRLETDLEKAKEDRYVQQVKEKFEQRSQTGINKYDTTLERDDLSIIDWLTHAQEEAMDLTLYLEVLKDKLK